MTWVLYVMIMTEARTLQGILSQHYFKTERECNKFYLDNKKNLDKSVYELIQPRITKREIIHVGCINTTEKK
tara:strand:+ start:350 stop:565 length:216 start_codon:yes stop_codon:yes gene_type:complete